MSRIAPVRGTDLEPNEWDEALMLARTVEEVKRIRVGVKKHYGPGPHPGTGTPQAVHGYGVQSQLSDEIFGPEPPTPRTKLVYTVEDWAGLTPVQQLRRPPAPSQPLTEEDEMIVRHAVLAWENFAGPGTLPDTLEIKLSAENDSSMAWVVPGNPDLQNVLHINDLVWNDALEFDTYMERIYDEYWMFAAGDLFTTGDPDGDEFTLRVSTLFHEVAHLAAMHQGWNFDYWPEELPHYDPEWYEFELSASDESLPSGYATLNKYEYFAEAMSDYWVNGENAAPLSKKTYEVFKELTS